MSRTLGLVLLIVLLTALAPAAADGQTIVGRSIAGIELGMTLEQARVAVPGLAVRRRAQETTELAGGGVRAVVGARRGRRVVVRVSSTRPEDPLPAGVGPGTTNAEAFVRRAYPASRCGRSSRSRIVTCGIGGRGVTTFLELREDVVAEVRVERDPESAPVACPRVPFGFPGEPSFGADRVRVLDTTCAIARRVALGARPGEMFRREGFACDPRRPTDFIIAWRCVRPGSSLRYAATITFRVEAP